jgi:hypothetical protein
MTSSPARHRGPCGALTYSAVRPALVLKDVGCTASSIKQRLMYFVRNNKPGPSTPRRVRR